MERGAPLRAGDPAHVGPYEIVSRLGAGGMGVVFLARDPDGRPVAVKVVHAEMAADDEFRSRFRSEVNRVRQVPPFCTAEVLDADPDAPRPYLVTEFVDGRSLGEEVAEHGPLSASRLHALAIGVATALTAIHEAGVIHRDLKPHNVLLAPGTPKVIDFGIARAWESTTEHTRTGQIVGTANYMAPERFDESGTPLTPASDVFAWGCVVTYAGTGRAPFHADSPMSIFGRILTQEPDLGRLDEPLRGLVERSLARDPRQRPTARELLDMLLRGGTQRSPQLADALDAQPALRTAAIEVQATPGPAFTLPPEMPPESTYVPPSPPSSYPPVSGQPAGPSSGPPSYGQTSGPPYGHTSGPPYPPTFAGPPGAPYEGAPYETDGRTVGMPAGPGSPAGPGYPTGFGPQHGAEYHPGAGLPPGQAMPAGYGFHGAPEARPPAGKARGNRALAGTLVVLLLLVLGGAGGLLAAHEGGMFSVSEANDPVDAAAGTPGPAPADEDVPEALTLPKGRPFVADSLTSTGQWSATYIVDEEESNCDVRDGALRVQRVTPGSYICAGPEDDTVDGGYTLAVTARIEKPGSCIGVWLYWEIPRSYALTACEDTFRLTVERDNDTGYVIGEFPLDEALPLNEPLRMQVVVEDGSVRFGHDDLLIGEADLPEADITKGHVATIGMISAPGDDSPPYAASFNDVEIRTLGK